MRRWIKVLAAVVVVLVVIAAVLGLLANANTFRPVLESRLTQALGRKVTLGNLHFSPFSGSLNADNVEIAGDPAFGPGPLLTAKELKVGVEMSPLIFHRELRVRSFQAVGPRINLVQDAAGNWNFSSLGRSGTGAGAGSQKDMSGLNIGKIGVSGGLVTVASYPPQSSPRVYSHVDLSIRNFSSASKFPFSVHADVPGNGIVAVDGTAGPVNQQDAAATPLHAQVVLKNVDPVAAGFVAASAGVSMLANANVMAQSNGTAVQSNGTLKLSRLQISPNGKPIPQPVDLTYVAVQQLKGGAGQVESAELRTGGTAIHVTGQYRLQPQNPWVDLNVSGQNLPIDQLQGLLISSGVKLPNGSVLKGGTLTLNLNATGPVNALVITGPVALANTQLAGFNLGSKLSSIAALAGVRTGNTTEIQSLRFTLRSASGAIQTDNIDAVMPALGVATGSGTVSPAGALDYQLVVRLATTSGLGKAGVGLLSSLNGLAGSEVKSVAANGIPVRITGTTSSPVISANVGGLLQRSGILPKGQTNTPAGLLKGLLGGR